MSVLFVGLMRAGGVPARILTGRWAASQDKDQAQTHVKAEFFAHGIGWVPVDTSGAVGDTAGNDYAFLGNDPGDFVAMAADSDLLVDSFVAGRQDVQCLQGCPYWWRGSGGDAGASYVDDWLVRTVR
jgi:hypothetical protein